MVALKVVSFFESFIDEQRAVNKLLLKPTKRTKLYAASKMSAGVRDRFFKCAKVDLLMELDH